MRALILGCGAIGMAVGAGLAAAGHQVVGVRRQPAPAPRQPAGVPRQPAVDGAAPFPLLAGDLGDPHLYVRLADADAVLLAANPGLRRGRDNGLAGGAALLTARFPAARVVYTGTTAVYADAGGAAVDEGGALLVDDPAVAALLAIERPFASHPRALVLRVAAIVGPERTHALERLRAGELTVRGDPERPFSWVHEDDLVALCRQALLGAFGVGTLNCAAPGRMSVGEYHLALARHAGLRLAGPLVGDGRPAPSRAIDAGRLQALTPGWNWRGP